MGTQHKTLAGAAFPGVQGKDGWFPLCSALLLMFFSWAMSLSRSAARLTQKALCRFQGKEPFSGPTGEKEEATILAVLKRLYTGNYFRSFCLFPKSKLMPEADQNPLECPVPPPDPWGSVCVYLTAHRAAPSLDHLLV